MTIYIGSSRLGDSAASPASHPLSFSILKKCIQNDRRFRAFSNIRNCKQRASSSNIVCLETKNSLTCILKVTKEYPANSHTWIPTPLERFAKAEFLSSSISISARIPKVYDIGHISIEGLEYVYILQEYLSYPTALSAGILREDLACFARALGEVSFEIHAHKMSGYGVSFTSNDRSFSAATWSEFIARFQQSLCLDKLSTCNVLPKSLLNALEYRMKSLLTLECEPRLFHGDMLYNWSNILIDSNPAKVAAVIDWDYSGSGNPLVFELGSSILSLQNNLGPSQSSLFIQAYLSGYGLKDMGPSLTFSMESIAAIFGCQLLINRSSCREHLYWSTKESISRILRKSQ